MQTKERIKAETNSIDGDSLLMGELVDKAPLTGLISKLPIDVIVEILSRLPIKSLSQCRWVSKSLYHLIHHPLVIRAHHTQCPNPPSVIFEHRLTLPRSFSKYSSNSFNYYCIIDPKAFDSRKTDLCMANLDISQNNTIVGSSNGLICFEPLNPRLPYYIGNPVTGEHIRFPIHNLKGSAPDTIQFVSGFGFNSSADQYKVLRVEVKKTGSHDWLEAEVYTHGSNTSWRHIPNQISQSFDPLKRYNNVFVQGAFHWLGYNKKTRVIVSFQLVTDEFGAIALPSEIAHNTSSYCEQNLGVLGECLCLMNTSWSNFVPASAIIVWVMEVYGVEWSWTRKYKLRHDVIYGVKHPLRYRGCELIKLMTSGELLILIGGERLGYYDLKKKKFKLISDQGRPSTTKMYHFIHEESLVSPKSKPN